MGPKDREPRGERSEVTWSTDVNVFRRVIAADDEQSERILQRADQSGTVKVLIPVSQLAAPRLAPVQIEVRPGSPQLVNMTDV